MIKPFLFIQATPGKGRGVFTSESIAAETVIEVAPVIVMNPGDREQVDKTALKDYVFEWGERKDKVCMALGYIPIYNHSYESNCEYFMDYEEELIFIKSVRNVEAGEELTINYNGDFNDPSKVWFETSP